MQQTEYSLCVGPCSDYTVGLYQEAKSLLDSVLVAYLECCPQTWRLYFKRVWKDKGVDQTGKSLETMAK